MTLDRSNLDNPSSNRFYIILTIILVILSILGLYLYFAFIRPSETSTPTIIPEDDYPSITSKPSLPPTTAIVSPSIKPLVTSVEPSPVPGTKGGVSDGSPSSNGLLSTDKFIVRYSPDKELYQTNSGGNTRYTLYSSSGKIAIHVGPSWSWVHPGRTFTSDFKVSDQPTFVYKIASQTIVDFQVDQTKYTIQCVHGGNSTQKSECDQLLSDFKLL